MVYLIQKKKKIPCYFSWVNVWMGKYLGHQPHKSVTSSLLHHQSEKTKQVHQCHFVVAFALAHEEGPSKDQTLASFCLVHNFSLWRFLSPPRAGTSSAKSHFILSSHFFSFFFLDKGVGGLLSWYHTCMYKIFFFYIIY